MILREVYSQIPAVIIILLLCNILLKVVVGDDKVSVEQLGNRIVHGGSLGKKLGVVDIKVGIDEIDIAVDGGGVNR
jgi:hypothetical protein